MNLDFMDNYGAIYFIEDYGVYCGDEGSPQGAHSLRHAFRRPSPSGTHCQNLLQSKEYHDIYFVLYLMLFEYLKYVINRGIRYKGHFKDLA